MITTDSPAIGIDLGTTYCCVGVLKDENYVEIIENEDGYRTTPSYIAFTDTEEIIGTSAKKTVFRNPENIVYDSKRLIGRNFDDKYLQQNLNTWTFKVTSDPHNRPLINISQKGKIVFLKPHEVSARILSYMKHIAEQSLETKVKDAVITVPAYFNHNQRSATKEAGKLAGLNVLKIINEPTAAALAYIHKHKPFSCKFMVMFDLGGGTFDVSILQLYGKSITIRATSGNTHLGGRDFDNNLTNLIVEEIKEKYGSDIVDKRMLQKIREKSERIKITLSTQRNTYLEFSKLRDKDDFDVQISRNAFEKVNMHLFQKCIETVKICLKDAKVEKDEVEKIILVGGSTRIPKIQEMLSSVFEGKKLSKAIHPDEAVAYGAAVQAAMIRKGDEEELAAYITEVTPLSLGTNILGERMSVVIPRNTHIPIIKTVTYLTTVDKQSTMCFNIYEGERSLVKYNNILGTTTIELPRKPPGYAVDVTFHIDENGMLEIATKTEKGFYSSMAVDYNYHDEENTNGVIEDALENKASDRQTYDAITEWSKLNEYCNKIKAICNYSKRGMKSEEKYIIRRAADEGLKWLDNNTVKNGSEEEFRRISKKQNDILSTCEPIVNKYGYRIKNMSIFEFHKIISR